jgi:hypothetical protein
MSAKVTVETTGGDRLAEVEKAMRAMRRTAIYVGIAKSADENRRKGEPIDNADLGYIHEYGSAAAHIPPRPFLTPGVRSAKGAIGKGMQAAAKAALDGKTADFDRSMERTALIAQTAVPTYVRENQDKFVPLAERTEQARLKKIKAVRGKGTDITILMDTGQLLGAIRGMVVKE